MLNKLCNSTCKIKDISLSNQTKIGPGGRLQIEEFETKTGLHCELSYTNKTSVSNRNIKIGIGFITTFRHSGIQKSTRKKKK
jgi:hypothetical protein